MGSYEVINHLYTTKIFYKDPVCVGSKYASLLARGISKNCNIPLPTNPLDFVEFNCCKFSNGDCMLSDCETCDVPAEGNKSAMKNDVSFIRKRILRMNLLFSFPTTNGVELI